MRLIRAALIFPLIGLCFSAPGFAQAPQSDSATLHAILAELRGIHDDMRLTQVSQILLTELQTQQTVVNAATDRADKAQLRLSDLQQNEKTTTATLAGAEDMARNAQDSTQSEALSQQVDSLKAALAATKAREEGAATILQTAQSQLRIAQDALDDIQQRLDAVVKKLQPAPSNP